MREREKDLLFISFYVLIIKKISKYFNNCKKCE